jgi:hypothetical protein
MLSLGKIAAPPQTQISRSPFSAFSIRRRTAIPGDSAGGTASSVTTVEPNPPSLRIHSMRSGRSPATTIALVWLQ